ncbi:MAG: 30S ribosomal protein S16 [Candidatus Omnitrophica bacterium]|nr:30S ribosomal protein S16 [Candidatus Omnitrophota bacterium]
MEVRIRLQRIGKSPKNCRNFRIVAISKSTKRDGATLDILGHYEPYQKPAGLSIDQEKLNKWVKVGAQMSATVKALAKQAAKAKIK